jgi:hypothetical protein
MPDPSERLYPPQPTSPRGAALGLSDRQIALASLIVAAIAAVAAIAVVPEFRCWALHDNCPPSDAATGAASIPTVTGLAGLIAFFLLKRAQGNDHIFMHLIEKIRQNAPELFREQLVGMKPSALSKAIQANVTLRTQVGEHDFALLQTALRNQFVISLVIYCVFSLCFLVGAILYFLLRPPPFIAQRLILQSDDVPQIAVTGSVDILYGTEKRSASFSKASDVSIGGIPRDEIGGTFTLVLNSDDYELKKVDEHFNFSNDPVRVPVKLKDFAPYAGAVFVRNAPVEGAKVALYGLPCKSVTEKGGYFEFRDCPQSRRLEAPKLELTLPSREEPCPNHFPLFQPPKLTGVSVDEDCNNFNIVVLAPGPHKDPPPDLDGKDVFYCQKTIVAEILNYFQTHRTDYRRPCGMSCHVNISARVANIVPFGLKFPAPPGCADGQFIVDQGNLLQGH